MVDGAASAVAATVRVPVASLGVNMNTAASGIDVVVAVAALPSLGVGAHVASLPPPCVAALLVMCAYMACIRLRTALAASAMALPIQKLVSMLSMFGQ